MQLAGPGTGPSGLARTRRSVGGSPTRRRPDEEGPLGGVPVAVVVRCRPPLQEVPVVKITAAAKGSDRFALHLDPGDSPEAQVPSYLRERGRTLEARTFRCNGFCGECSSQEDVFAHAEPVVDRVMGGYNGTIFCYGITGSGKSFTMSGRPPEQHEGDGPQQSVGGSAHGIVQRAARRIFEFIRDRSAHGEVFSVEASFLEIYSSDGISETLLDLLADGSKHDTKLEVRQDPLNKQAFACEGLTSAPISSPDEMFEILEAGRRRCTFMETTRNCHSSRSHCLFIVTVECLPDETSSQLAVRRGKLVLVDLAGSESLKKVVAANDGDENLRRRQAIGINRVLSHLGTVVNNLNAGHHNSVGYRNSALTMLLRDCLGGAARALLIANIGPEVEWCNETYMTLTFAQKMMQVRNVEKQTIVDESQSTLLQMRQRHQECIERLKETAAVEGEGRSDEELQKLQLEVSQLNGRLLTKSNVTETLDRLQAEQKKKMDDIRTEMTQTMTDQFATMQEHSVREFAELRQVIETKTREGGAIVERQWRAASEAQLASLQETLTATIERHKVAISEAAQLRVQLGAADKQVQMLQELQQESLRTRAELDQERQSVRQQAEEQQERLLDLDREVNRYRVEADVLRSQVEQQRAVKADDAAAAHAEREAWNAREAELRASLQSVREKLDTERVRARFAAQESAEHREAVDGLRGRIMQLEAEGGLQRRQLEEARRARMELEDEVFEVQDREAALQHRADEDAQLFQEDLDRTKRSVQDIMRMLEEVQDSVMLATNRPPNR